MVCASPTSCSRMPSYRLRWHFRHHRVRADTPSSPLQAASISRCSRRSSSGADARRQTAPAASAGRWRNRPPPAARAAPRRSARYKHIRPRHLVLAAERISASSTWSWISSICSARAWSARPLSASTICRRQVLDRIMNPPRRRRARALHRDKRLRDRDRYLALVERRQLAAAPDHLEAQPTAYRPAAWDLARRRRGAKAKRPGSEARDREVSVRPWSVSLASKRCEETATDRRRRANTAPQADDNDCHLASPRRRQQNISTAGLRTSQVQP